MIVSNDSIIMFVITTHQRKNDYNSIIILLIMFKNIKNHHKIYKTNDLMWYDYWQLKSKIYIDEIHYDFIKLLKEYEYFSEVKNSILIYYKIYITQFSLIYLHLRKEYLL
jgi:hypothetical protein